MTKNKTWGGKRKPGPGKSLGRPPEPGIERLVKMRFERSEEYAKIIKETTPRQRAKIILSWLAENAGDL